NALGIEVEREVDEIDVAGAFAVAEQAALDAIGTRQQSQLRRLDTGAAVVVGMQRQHYVFTPLQARGHPLDLVRVHVGAGVLHRGRQVDDDGTSRTCIP